MTSAPVPNESGLGEGNERPIRRLLHTESYPVRIRASEIPNAPWCHWFGDMVDRTAEVVFRLGYDLDDVIFERYLVCSRPDEGEVHVRAEPLSDLSELARRVQRAAASGPMDDFFITGLRVDVILDQWPEPDDS